MNFDSRDWNDFEDFRLPPFGINLVRIKRDRPVTGKTSGRFLNWARTIVAGWVSILCHSCQPISPPSITWQNPEFHKAIQTTFHAWPVFTSQYAEFYNSHQQVNFLLSIQVKTFAMGTRGQYSVSRAFSRRVWRTRTRMHRVVPYPCLILKSFLQLFPCAVYVLEDFLRCGYRRLSCSLIAICVFPSHPMRIALQAPVLQT